MQKGRWTQEMADLQVKQDWFSAVNSACETAPTTPLRQWQLWWLWLWLPYP